ncbi:hypothetical protein C2G38_2226248 [Gigaspora rosea]|uniref:Uncharacterized protein n=1 Tax=Gigaspora rosea TaxID=44941 RepID=A0A397TYE8_9GLOM|nr:hypothetical protein C2G38_2226248 [Gigaspora rosea]
MDNKPTLVCNYEAYLRNPVLCKHIFVVSRKFKIEMPDQTTYLLIDNDIQVNNEQPGNKIVAIDNIEKQVDEINCNIDQWLERIENLHQRINLNNISIERKKDIVIKLEEIYDTFFKAL